MKPVHAHPADGIGGLEPFRVHVTDDEIEDLHRRLRARRLPERETVTLADGPPSWDQGVPLAYLDELCSYWLEGYDWRRLESELNSIGQFRTSINGVDVHFLHVRSPREDAVPLLITHGWPGSVVEFLDVVGQLADPRCPDEPAFEVIVPSLPGFGFSGTPDSPGWGVQRMADAGAELMHRVGHDHFVAQGGDWGGVITTELAARHSERLLGIHTTFPQAAEPRGTSAPLAPHERQWLTQTRDFWSRHSAYAQMQATRPQTIGYGLLDSPVALLAWIVDKFALWIDGDVTTVIDRDRLLDNVSLYWFGRSGASAARIYWESYGRSDTRTKVHVPTAISVFPQEIEKLPRSWVEGRYRDVVRYRILDHGGHFPSLEVPDVYVSEVRAGLAQCLRRTAGRTREGGSR